MMPYEHPTSHPEDRTLNPRASRALSIAYCQAIVTGQPFNDDPDAMREARDVLLSDILLPS
jgi:hypothetical protein